MALAAHAHNSQKKTIKTIIVVGLLLHGDHGLIPSRTGRLYVGILQFDLQNLIEVQDRLACVADLEILVDHPYELSSREKACLFFRKVCMNEDFSFEISVDDLLETLRFCIKLKNLEVCLQLDPSDKTRRFFRLAIDFPDS